MGAERKTDSETTTTPPSPEAIGQASPAALGTPSPPTAGTSSAASDEETELRATTEKKAQLAAAQLAAEQAAANAAANRAAKPKWRVAKDNSITSLRGVLDEHTPVTAKDFQGGEAVIKELVDRKLLEPNP